MPVTMTPVQTAANGRKFPKFDLARLLGTVFEPTFGRRICILIDLPDLSEAKDYGLSEESGAQGPAEGARDIFT